ncbi:PREDICTED: cytochrome b561 and DOMON domain-containing protein At3g07570-like [Nelumbo nucifera]|uniref:Cytochrome b561 and DOMON domain-containing protein At3g07570-like n=1 Tax=Nelumbo nucifera TaxID=4432 RepID=A0A1U8AYS8_NELNU|nr:PREDICTED: cytochrome b561 and DOMON domain-containing protein At3g07570-like [Nelumbo nucifera]
MGVKNSLVATLFIFICFSSFASSQSDSCSSNLNLNGLVSFDTVSLHCYPVWNAKDYILRYLQAGPELWSFVLSAPDIQSYVGIGFSSNGLMVGSSAIVGWAPAGGTPAIKQYYLGATNENQVLPDQGNLQIVNNSMVIISQSSRLYLAFQLSTSEPESRILYSLGPSNWFPSSDYRLTQHQDRVSTSMNFVTGQSSVKRPYTKLRRGHGTLNMLGWSIFMIIGAMSARYFREWDPAWFYFHATIQSLGFIMGSIGVILGFVLDHQIKAAVSRHKVLGVFILSLGCLQVIAFMLRPRKDSKVRRYWNWYHHTVGRVLIILSMVNVFYGIHLGKEGDGWKAGYGVVLGVLILVAIMLEIRMWKRM